MGRGMGVGMTDRDGLISHIQRNGIPPLLDGASLESFGALELAQALEHEVNRGTSPVAKVRIDLDYQSAMRLASYLRRAVSAGV
jgi:hypothetical protein